MTLTSRAQEAGRGCDLTSKPGEQSINSDGVVSLLLLGLVGNKGFMYAFFTPAKKIAIYNDLTFLFFLNYPRGS